MWCLCLCANSANMCVCVNVAICDHRAHTHVRCVLHFTIANNTDNPSQLGHCVPEGGVRSRLSISRRGSCSVGFKSNGQFLECCSPLRYS